MPEMFPVKRFRGAGATKEETDQLVREFERSDISLQQDMIKHFKPQSRSALRDYVENLRQEGHFTDASQTSPDASNTDFDDLGVDDSADDGKSSEGAESIDEGQPDVITE